MSKKRIDIDLSRQRLRLYEGKKVLREYKVSTAEKGAGERSGSYQTPRGRHKIRAMIGRGAPSGAVFVSRRFTGEVYSAELRKRHPDRDWILTRILWLSGLEPGKNRLRDVDTMRRYIYLHGTPAETRLGKPGSHGCVRMANKDIVELFDLVKPGTEVDIHE
ncbi:MAG: L,D-transpeptidase family protein [Gammaproteobacteria bacterium]